MGPKALPPEMAATLQTIKGVHWPPCRECCPGTKDGTRGDVRRLPQLPGQRVVVRARVEG